MNTLIEAVRELLGSTVFYRSLGEGKIWDYGMMLEYFFAGCVLLIVVGSVFKIIRAWIER